MASLRPTPALQAVRLLPHRQYHSAQLLLFAGRREQGKTTALRAYVETREPRVLVLDPFDDFGTIRRRGDLALALEELGDGEPCRRRVVPPMGVGSHEYAEALFSELVEREVGDLLLVLDELTLWSKPRASVTLTKLVLQGRRLGIRIAAAIQRIALTPDVMQSELTELVLFNIARPRDLETVADWTDGETAETCSKLRQGQCLALML